MRSEERADMKRILVALDSSPRAKSVLDAAVELAQRTGAKLILFRAIGLQPEIPLEAYSSSPNRLIDVLSERARGELSDLGRSLPAGMVEGVATHVGVPWETVCNAGREHAADLIIIGSHGYGGIDRVIGTTAGKIVNHADRPVLVYRPVAGWAD